MSEPILWNMGETILSTQSLENNLFKILAFQLIVVITGLIILIKQKMENSEGDL